MRIWSRLFLLAALVLATSGCTMYGFGANDFGDIGDGTTHERIDPVAAARNPDWLKVDAGYYHSCGITTDLALYCWGNNTRGELGLGTTGSFKSVPTRVGTGTDWTDVSAGGASSSQSWTCGIRAGALFCWGYNFDGQLGVGDKVGRTSPAPVGTETDWRSVSAGEFNGCAIKTNGALYCWGPNGGGTDGDGTTTDRLAPARVGAASDWRSVSVGGGHACGMRGPNALYCWGTNHFGQLGLGSAAQVVFTTPQQVDATKSWTKVAAGDEFTCAIASGAASCWGTNNIGELGNGTIDPPNQDLIAHPVPTPVGTATDWTDIAAGPGTVCGIRAHNELDCWGNGLAGDGTSNGAHLVPTRSGLDKWWSISLGVLHKVGLRNLAD